MNIPSNLKYTKDHEWLSIDDNNLVTIGITDFAQSELGDIVFVEVETIGQTMNQNDVFGTVEAVKTVSDLFLPVSGTVKEVNQAVLDSPELINEDPYLKGWIIKMEVADLNELESLLDADAYQKIIGN